MPKQRLNPTDEEVDEPRTESGSAENRTKDKERSGSVLWALDLPFLPTVISTLEALTSFLLRQQEHDRLLALYVGHLQVEENEKVWQAILRYFTYIRANDPKNLAGFISDLFKRYPNLVATREAALMLAHLHWQLPELVHEVLLGWRQTKQDHLQQAYGELVALIALLQPDLTWPQHMLAELVDTNEMPRARVGAAYTAVNLWSDQKRRAAASQLVQALVPVTPPVHGHQLNCSVG